MNLSTSSFKQKDPKKPNPWITVGLLLILPLLLLELWVSPGSHSAAAGKSLFNYVSYTNSRNMDPQIEHFEARQDWNYIAIGSSEAKWGIVPTQINTAFTKRGLQAKGFNLGLDGFGPSYYQAVLPHLELPARLPNLRVALIGLNLIEESQLLPQSFDTGFSCDGILQRAVLNSAFAKDYGLYHLCNTRKWPTPLVSAVEKISATVRYRQALRTLLLGQNTSDFITLASNGLTQYPDGFYAHKSIKDNQKESAIDYQNFLNQKAESPRDFKPLASDHWPNLVMPEGFFDQWSRYFEQHHIVPVFFALPTNPLMIDAKNRRADYIRNSQLMQNWVAKRASTAFVDLGIKDDYDPTGDFADYRHLSEAGAIKFSRELGERLAQQSAVLQAFESSSGSIKSAESLPPL